MKNSIYLYGDNFDAKRLSIMNYVSALFYKIKCSEELIAELNKEPYMQRDTERIRASLESQKFNQELIKECET